ncbi:helix-turn-helix domain-containing protein [Gemella sanguinis]|jgi:DNA-binding helix-turn-helix protein|uniref:helix-turn-helix domain-containing protein n=1 Tax=Gemella sanguinis TaxID=84135 RepID=UPI0008076C1F|nr:helix-turn-helix transcriptional regulator [Gemella sanguinis]
MKVKINKSAVGSRIKQIRLNRGYTLEAFGKLFGAKKGNVQQWEKGISLPNKERIKNISKIADLTVNELLYGSIDEFLDNNLQDLLEYQEGNIISSPEEYSIARQQFKKWLEERNITLENITNVYDYIDQDTETWTPWRVDMEYIKTMEEIRENMREGTYSLITLIEMLTDKDRKRLFKHIIKMLKSYQLTDKDKKLIDDMGKRYD